MSPHLPPSIALYVSTANRNATQSAKDCFTDDALVKDERKTYCGIDEIQRWMTDTHAKYHHTIEPRSVQEDEKATIVTCLLTGTFPGSPIEVPFKFVLRDSRIARLDIG
ncbi:MAG TPA: nuclear transport factor 2 family protein [Steroidobacteraceae bacterium]|nr:nuclear transport factor 2 family protein [Steroidobacteraceae bacterium]